MHTEKRRSSRNLVMKSIEYLLIPSIITRVFDGVIMDISDSGLCLLTTSRLKDRQRIIIQDKSFSSEKVAIVRWSEKYDDMFYKIGLEFTEDQSFLNIKGRRRYKRLDSKNINIRGKMAGANYMKIIDLSLDGLSFETDKKLHIGKEYILHLQYGGKTWSIKGSIAWSKLKENDGNNEVDIVQIYRAGMKITVSSNEMREVIKFIDLRQRMGEKRENFSLSPDADELNTCGKDNKCLESSLHSR